MEESTSHPGSFRNPLVGQQIGSYRVLATLGSGGMSTVYRAVHVETGHEVALKVLLGTLSRSSTLLQRFLREARSAETLEHSNIVTIYDRGVDQGRHYLVLEFVAGGDFHDYVQRHGPLGTAEAIVVIRGVAGGLRYAAGRGLIHRDIKPSNILRTPSGEPKVIDLGLALQSQFEDERVTREGTTVGTVDYMAPEQARDSRATSVQSDMYSLGCTFYYLLAGVPPFPGGDITEKLTRHARAPAPDIRDLRPDIPADVAGIILRLLAKQPDDRFGDYDQLIAALDAVGRDAEDDADAIALAPIDGDETSIRPTPPRDAGPGEIDLADNSTGRDEDSSLLLLDSPDSLGFELADERALDHRTVSVGAPEAPLPRLGRADATDEPDDSIEEQGGDAPLAPRVDPAFPRWILATAAAASLATLLVVGLHLIFGGPSAPVLSGTEIPGPDAAANPVLGAPRSARAPGIAAGTRDDKGGSWNPRGVSPPARPPEPPKPAYEEPDDKDPVAGEPVPLPPGVQERRGHLPEWTRPRGASRPEDATVVVRRVAEATDGLTEPTLHLALDRHIGGTVEVADSGPFAVDDLRMSGESRLIKARRGYRPIIRILRSRLVAALDQSAFLPLERKSLTVEGIDFIVDARDLSGRQKALFGCVGSNLTLRDCTVTVINPTGVPFTLVRQEPATRQERPSRIWLERTLVRGSALTVAELSGGPADLVIDGTAILAGGVGPPLVRVSGAGGAEGQRIFLAGALLACPGPVIHCGPTEGAVARARPLVIRSDGSALGRLQGPGIASILSSTDERTPPGRQVEWGGDSNLFAGWKGFFARGPNGPTSTIVVDDLAAARSTWNASEQGSEWIFLSDWALPGEPARQVAADMAPFLSGRKSLLAVPARPDVGLFPKTFDAYVEPMIPEPTAILAAQAAPPGVPGPQRNAIVAGDARPAPFGRGVGAGPNPVPGLAGPGARPTSPGAPEELVLRTSDAQWGGDLGAFLRAQIPPDARRARVLVIGSGAHRSTPVRLPDGLTLEVRVEVDPRGDGLPTWSPDPQATGPGLIELRGGALVLSDLILRHDPASRLESLLALDDSHLVLSRCELTVPADSGRTAGDLIVFRAPTTRRMRDHPGSAVFQIPVDRPICRLIDTILIANGTALRAELGRGLVALTRCGVASDETAIELDAGKVARRSFGADLWLDRCTLVAGRSIIGLGRWPGVGAGPDRPWLVHSRRCAFVTLSDPKARDAVLLRVDADAYAGDCLFWQADGDAYELDRVVTSGEAAAAAPRRGELAIDRQWDHFWASHHATRTVTGPRSTALRFRHRPRPGRIEPSDLILEPVFAGQRGSFGMGADLPGTAGGPRRGLPTAPPN